MHNTKRFQCVFCSNVYTVYIYRKLYVKRPRSKKTNASKYTIYLFFSAIRCISMQFACAVITYAHIYCCKCILRIMAAIVEHIFYEAVLFALELHKAIVVEI